MMYSKERYMQNHPSCHGFILLQASSIDMYTFLANSVLINRQNATVTSLCQHDVGIQRISPDCAAASGYLLLTPRKYLSVIIRKEISNESRATRFSPSSRQKEKKKSEDP